MSVKLQGFYAGVDDYLVKPFDTEELVARVRTQLRHVERNLLTEMTGLIAAQVKKKAKSLPGSSLYVDQRR